MKQEFIENNRYEIYGANGWEDFDGVIINDGVYTIHEIMTKTASIKCTDKHKIVSENELTEAYNIKVGDMIMLENGIEEPVISNKIINHDITRVYDIFNSESHKVYINGILTSNCDEFAFVEPSWKADEFWASNYPTVSASQNSKIIIISTPNGMYNKFHEIYTNAEEGKNTFKNARYDYRVVPGRDEEWAKAQIQNLGKIKFNQEFGCLNSNQEINVLNKLTNEEECISIGQLYERISQEHSIDGN